MSNVVGVIGTGAMGGAIARRLLEQGFPLVVFDRNRSAMAPLEALGAGLASDPLDVANSADIVLASLPSPQASLDVAESIAACRRRFIYIETSTIGRETIRRISKLLDSPTISVLDAPVSGGVFAAADGALTVFLSGPQAAMDGAREMLGAISGKVFHLGRQVGASQLCKIINNAVAMAGMVAACEGLAVGARAGIPAETMLDVFNSGSASSWATLKFLPNTLLAGKPAGPISITAKDTGLYLAEAESIGAATPVTADLHERLKQIIAYGDPQRDTTGIHAYFVDIANDRGS